MDEKDKLYLERAQRAFQNKPVGKIFDEIKAIVGPSNMPPIEQSKLAEEALERLRNGERPTAKQLAALEFVIRLMRPVALSREGELAPLNPTVAPAFPNWTKFQKSVKPFLYSVGRIDIVPKESIGTGFLVSDGVLVTNKHVLDILSKGTGELEKGQAVVRFKHEAGNPDEEEPVNITGVVAAHEELDIALLQVERQKFTKARKPLALDPAPVEAGHPVVALGYPLNDPLRNPLFIRALFGDVFGVKRGAPGEVSSLGEQSIYHDCSTLGGNSGSPILSMKTARVVGLHREGSFLYRNEATDGASLGKFLQPHLKN
ncbi:MAG TPA: serine protease [Pyrinomonadaceae bacterium]|jgi:endonuclease G|nr:serine protease [Pyrinomonadaceae bacterium]